MSSTLLILWQLTPLLYTVPKVKMLGSSWHGNRVSF